MPCRTQNQGGLEANSKRGQQLARILLLEEVPQKENSHVECSTNDRVGRVACAWRESVRSFGSAGPCNLLQPRLSKVRWCEPGPTKRR